MDERTEGKKNDMWANIVIFFTMWANIEDVYTRNASPILGETGIKEKRLRFDNTIGDTFKEDVSPISQETCVIKKRLL